jgi:hypothetical protein
MRASTFTKKLTRVDAILCQNNHPLSELVNDKNNKIVGCYSEWSKLLISRRLNLDQDKQEIAT